MNLCLSLQNHLIVNLSLGLLYLMSFKSSLQSHPIWVTLYVRNANNMIEEYAADQCFALVKGQKLSLIVSLAFQDSCIFPVSSFSEFF